MKRALWLSVVLALATSVRAEPFGALFPATNTRYRSAVGEPRLVTNDRDFFLFWGAEKKIRAARIDDGEARVSHVALDANGSFDVAWTGDRYLIVSTRSGSPYDPNDSAVVVRVLDGEAHPSGAEFTIGIPDARMPRIAAGEHSVAVVYGTGSETRIVLLSRNGRTIEAESRVIAPGGSTHAVTRNGDGFLAIVATHDSIRAVALDQRGQTVAESTFAAPPEYRRVAVANDGTKSLVVWCDATRVVAITVDEHAGFGPPLELFGHPGFHNNPTVVSNGGGWTISYGQRSNSTTAQAVIVQLHREGQTILAREESAEGNVNPTIAALDGRILAAWRASGQDKSPVVVELPLAQNQRRETPYTPSPQTLLATASSAGGTLTVWSETFDGGVTTHAGIRNLQGQWSERRLATSSLPYAGALAASDGEGFAVVIAGSSASMVFLDSGGRPSGVSVPLPFTPSVMAWNGTNYGLIDGSSRGVLVSPAGAVSATVSIGAYFKPLALASDGNGFFLAGEVSFCDVTCIPVPIEINGARLGPDLKRVDEKDFRIQGYGMINLIGAAWNGSRYVLIGIDDLVGSFLAYVPVSRYSDLEIKPFDASAYLEAMTVLHDGTIALSGRVYPDGTANRVLFMNGEGVVLNTSDIEGSTTEVPHLEPLAGGGVAFIASSVQDAAPHDGTSRIVTAIARSSSVPPPTAPHIGVRVQNGVMTVDWSAPSGTVNGYRLEYRIDDDEWVEWEQWFAPGAQSKSIRQPSFGTQFAFRMRAFNDGGAGAYSATALTKPSRRRAVR